MKFFFPDSQDQVDPGFDFITEERDPFRVRQRDDRYPHEVLHPAPFDGLLVSKAIVDGTAMSTTGKYTSAQRHRLYSSGAEEFFRLATSTTRLKIMGDCGAFSYVTETHPPYTVDEVIDFYDGCGSALVRSVRTKRSSSNAPRWTCYAATTATKSISIRCSTHYAITAPCGTARPTAPISTV